MEKSKKQKANSLTKQRRKRSLVQALGALIINGNWKSFLDGTIYKGNLKHVCLPVLNCYSCPGALGACPIGSLQAVPNSAQFNFSYYVVVVLSQEIGEAKLVLMNLSKVNSLTSCNSISSSISSKYLAS